MRIWGGFKPVCWAAPLLLSGIPAFGDNLSLKITNDGTDDIEVTVYDLSVRPRATVLSTRINGFTTIPLTVTTDTTGRANIAWTAVTLDPDHRRCGNALLRGLADSSAVRVHADGDCRALRTSRRAGADPD